LTHLPDHKDNIPTINQTLTTQFSRVSFSRNGLFIEQGSRLSPVSPGSEPAAIPGHEKARRLRIRRELQEEWSTSMAPWLILALAKAISAALSRHYIGWYALRSKAFPFGLY
jgi:hypothetical protein